LNKTCPKDEYPLPRIKQIIDSTTTDELLSFLYAYFGCHQIIMSTEEEEKTTFVTPFGVFCYVEMSFVLKNVGATYHTCVYIVLEDHIRRNIETYIDDIIVKSKQHGGLLLDLKETFDNLRKYRMKFNPRKCVFGVFEDSCLATWCTNAESMPTLKRFRLLSNFSHLECERRSIS
jgi:hypothetical protein